MKKLIALSALLLTGCAQVSTGSYEVDSNAVNFTSLAFAGIPLVLGTQGTTTPISADLSLTAKHVAEDTFRDTVASHSTCDVALIRDANAHVTTKFGAAVVGEKVRIYGYSANSTLPVSSSGKIKSIRYYRGCQVGVTDAGSVQGMSGGAVVNSKGQLVGIFFGLDNKKNLSYFVPYQQFKSILPRGVDHE